jgi:hypothetical protein
MRSYSLLSQITTLIFLSIFCGSCEVTRTQTKQEPQQTQLEKPEFNIVYDDLVVKESDYLMIPIRVSEENKGRESIFSSKASYYDARKNFYNIIFYHKQDGRTHLLLNKKAVITSFDFLEKKEKDKPSQRFIIYRIIENDTNKDNKLTYEDASIGYLSDVSGKNLQQITPNNTQLLNWTVVQSANALFLKITKDSNNDNKFTDKDKTNFIKMNLDKPGIGNEIISEQTEQQIKSLLAK